MTLSQTLSMKPGQKTKGDPKKAPASLILGRFEAWEKHLGYPQVEVAGVDEVGRGCLAGPVVAGVVLLPRDPLELSLERHPWLAEVKDSKLVSPAARERLAPLIRTWARASAVAEASVKEIDSLNIYHAAHLAMIRAVESLTVRPQHVLVDGNRVPKAMACPATPIVKGDLKVLSIACASILAKVYRDQLMLGLEESFPGYGFAIHKGYATPAHTQALESLGACEAHRRTFAPVAKVLQRGASFTGG